MSCVILSEEELASQNETAESNSSPTHEGLESRSKVCEEGGLKRSSTRSGSPPPPLEGRVSPTDGEEADEEDGDSEDSDESDEELRTYSIQEQSEESEEEILTVPIIVSDCSDAHNSEVCLRYQSCSKIHRLTKWRTKRKWCLSSMMSPSFCLTRYLLSSYFKSFSMIY